MELDSQTVTPGQAMEIALGHYRAGRIPEAESIYRKVLQSEPQNPEALHFLGVAARQRGAHELAVELIEQAAQCLRQALSIEPDNADTHNNLGVVLHELGRLAEAEAHLDRALALNPGNAEGHYNLGNVLHAAGYADRAAESYRRALELRPAFALAHNNLGNVMRDLGRLEEARQNFLQAVERDPRLVEAHYNLAGALIGLRRPMEAEGYFRQALALRPTYADVHLDLGRLLLQLGRPEEAEQSLRQALALQPGFVQAQNNLGILLHFLRRLTEAEQILRRAVALEPDYAEAHNNLGVVLKGRGRPQEAELSFRRALELKPGDAGAMSNLAETQKDTGRIEEALDTYRRTIALEPGSASMHGDLLRALSYRPGVTLAALAEAHAEFERRHALPLRSTWAPHANTPDPGRPLRLGFVSADLGMHPIGYLMADVLAQLDRREFVVFVYSSRVLKDAQTDRLKQKVGHWRDASHLDDEALATQIRADGIDVLFDLSGHTGDNRLLVFARRPAPIQIAWLGYAGTTGLSAMDYLLADAHLVPPQFDRFYAETIVRLPGAIACYRLPDEVPEVGPLPALRNGFVTFGSFNNPAKVTPDVIALWSRILTRLPTARMMLKYLGFDDPACRDRYAKLFAEGGVDPSRVSFLGHTPMADMFARYNELDIALDPFPFSGGATTLLTLAMGVPVVTLPGETMASRLSLSILRALGVEELVATSADDCVARVVALAGDQPRLAALRAGLRERFLRAPFSNPARFVRELESTLRTLWRRWCDNPSARVR